MRLRIRINVSTILFFLTVLSLENFASLIPSNEYIVQGLIRFYDIGTILGILLFMWSYLGVNSKRRIKYAYGKDMVAFFAILFISSLMAYKFFNQSVLLGIRSERKLITCFLLYFSAIRLLKTGGITYRDFVRILILVGTFEMSVYILQYILPDRIFIYANADERYNSMRLRVPYLFPLVIGFRCVSDIMTGQAKRVGKIVLNLAIFCGAAFLLIVVCKNRAPTFCLLVTMCVAYLIWKKGLSKKILIGILAVSIVFTVFLNTDLFYNIVNTSIKDITSRSKNLTSFTIRKMGQLYYLEKLTQSPFFGFGPPNMNNEAACIAAGFRKNYLLVDNGVLGFAYTYGIAGICWLIFLFIKTYKMSFYLLRNHVTYMPFLYFFYETLNLYIGMHWYYAYHLPFVAALIMLEYEYTTNFQKVSDYNTHDKRITYD